LAADLLQNEISSTRSGENSAMPPHQGLWPDDHHGLEDRPAPTIKLDEEQAIAIREQDPTDA
jgi:hypothetical protein